MEAFQSVMHIELNKVVIRTLEFNLPTEDIKGMWNKQVLFSA